MHSDGLSDCTTIFTEDVDLIEGSEVGTSKEVEAGGESRGEGKDLRHEKGEGEGSVSEEGRAEEVTIEEEVSLVFTS